MSQSIRRLLCTAATVGAFVLAAGAASAQNYNSMSCDQLWYQRNSIYKEHGYCFKTDRAINAFGNRGCYVDNERNLQLSRSVRSEIDLIVSIERQKGCR